MPDTQPSARPVIGVPREGADDERRVALIPPDVASLISAGFDVHVESNAGAAAGFLDETYLEAGATLGDDVYDSDLVVKINPPTEEEVARLQEGAALISLLWPADNADLIKKLAARSVTALALDRIPRITRAQKMDVLSSMANIGGYRAVLEASHLYQGFFGPQVTAAGSEPPAKVLIIGAGVAGLAAIAAARSLGADVRAFDVRPDTKEQIESLGARFLMLDFGESGEGEGGYAKTMSKEFIDAEMALFAEQAREVDVIITTALIPGKPAPTLITREMVESMKSGSVIVDLAAERGGNCELAVSGEHVRHEGPRGVVHILGYTDLPSRMARTASRFFSGNVKHLLADLTDDGALNIDLEDEVVRAAVQTHGGEVLPPPERKPAPAPKAVEPEAVTPTPKKKKAEPEPNKATSTLVGAVLGAALFALVGRYAPAEFVQHFSVFVLACFVGWQVVWAVVPALHTPLMSVTNAISGIILIGGMLQAGSGDSSLPAILGAVALFFGSINVAGGFLVTQRMLGMFRKGGRS